MWAQGIEAGSSGEASKFSDCWAISPILLWCFYLIALTKHLPCTGPRANTLWPSHNFICSKAVQWTNLSFCLRFTGAVSGRSYHSPQSCSEDVAELKLEPRVPNGSEAKASGFTPPVSLWLPSTEPESYRSPVHQIPSHPTSCNYPIVPFLQTLLSSPIIKGPVTVCRWSAFHTKSSEDTQASHNSHGWRKVLKCLLFRIHWGWRALLPPKTPWESTLESHHMIYIFSFSSVKIINLCIISHNI